MHDSAFYILQSNGNIEIINFSIAGDTIFNRVSKFPADGNKKKEFESLFYDSELNKVILVCKDCEGDKKNYVSSFAFDPSNDTYVHSEFSINVKQVAEKLHKKEIKLKPSAAAVNPVTKDIWILASENKLLIVTDKSGNTKEVCTLNPVIFNQPEGITFTPWGDLLISNEAGDKYSNASLLIFKQRKKI